MSRFLHILAILMLLKNVKAKNECSDFSISLPPDISLSNLTQQINFAIDHLKDENSTSLAALIPDPFNCEDIKQTVYGYDLTMFDIQAFGVSKVQIKSIKVQFDRKMEASFEVFFKHLKMTGNYSLISNGFFKSTSRGPFTIKVYDLQVLGRVKVVADKSGKLKASKILADADVTKMETDFENIQGFAGFFTDLLKKGQKTFFNIIKPDLIVEGQKIAKIKIDEKIERAMGDILLPNSINTIDFVISKAREFVKKCNDPFKLPDYVGDGLIKVQLQDTELRGLSTFYRLGDIKLNVKNKKVHLHFDVGTQQLKGSANWELSMLRGMVKRKGKIQFSVEYFKVFCDLYQPADISKPLQFQDLQLEMGNIQILSGGLGTLDYLVELFINTIPNLLRYQLMDAIETPLRQRLQEIADENVAETLIKTKLRELSETGTITMKLEL